MKFTSSVGLCALLAILLLISIDSGEAKRARIVGGQTSTISTMKYLVYLRRYGSFVCGGTLIRERFAITAAHCISGYSSNAFTLTGGTSYLNKGGVTRQVIRVFIPPEYSSSTMNKDLAVLKLKSPLTGTNIKPIALCSHTIPAGAAMRVGGWGITSENSESPSTQMRTSSIKLKTGSFCRRKYAGYSYTNTMMCAASPNTDTCSGDSGGPVVHKGQVCGVVSWGVGCARQAYPGVYTVVNRLKSFILRSLKS